jgi:alpha-mannosidase
LSDPAVQITAFKRAEEGGDLIVRLFEPTGRRRKTTLSLESCGVQAEVQMDKFEIKTLRVDRRTGRFSEVSLLEGS